MVFENYGTGVYGPYYVGAAPVSGTNEVQTLTIGGTPTGGTFTLSLDGLSTAAITWSNVNATLLAAINAALDAKFGASQIVATAGTLTAGIGTILLTFSGSDVARRAVNTMSASSSLTGTSPTLAVAETTPGVEATGRNAPRGALVQDTATGILYSNTGTPGTPTWTKVGAQT